MFVTDYDRLAYAGGSNDKIRVMSTPVEFDPGINDLNTESHLWGTINGFRINFMIDSGATLTSVPPALAKQAGLDQLNVVKTIGATTASGDRNNLKIVEAEMTLDGANGPIMCNIGLDPAIMDPHAPALLSMNDVVKAFDVSYTNTKIIFTPLSRPYKRGETISTKKSRLGWSNDWI